MDTIRLMRTQQDAASAVAGHLRRQISDGLLPPGTPLRQEALAKQLGVSRMPVRDALKTLSAEGLLTLHPNRGTFVSSLTSEDCAEIFHLRTLLETDALRLALPNHTDSSRRRLRFVQNELELSNRTQQWLAGDREFHHLLYSPSNRPRTLEMIQNLRDAVERFYSSEIKHSDRRDAWKKEHRLILKALEANDPHAACAALVRHLRETEQVVQSRLKQIQRKDASPNVKLSS